MTPDEVINALSKMGVNLTRRSLLNYEYQDLITKPERGKNGGPGGRWTNYKKISVAEAYAAHCMLSGNYVDDFTVKMSPNFIKMCRRTLNELVESKAHENKTINKIFSDFGRKLYEHLIAESQNKLEEILTGRR